MIRTFVFGEEEYIIQSHYSYYNKEHNFDLSFKKFIREGVEQFIENFNKEKDNLWFVEVNQRLKGSIAISHMNDSEAQLRWYLVEPELTGQGYGKKLLEKAINFCIEKKYETITLWTNNKLTRARELYSKYGFNIIDNKEQFLSNQLLVTECWHKDLKTS
ncbi:GNAT family N-acetyltransferase [Paenibacillus harenae]|uniref:GNAT family N-acetyltransferase n=1 Tax=Paenibacillus harenae TaxID=306543 RepID=UPI000688DCC1|nr:GNAT family N-acetyltransferase [Paenibacillus harenae]